MIITIPSTTQDIGIQLSTHYAAQKKNIQTLFQIFSSIKFLCRQGLPLRGDGTEADGNLQQLLKMQVKEDHNLAEWLRRKGNVYTSSEIQNEVIRHMGITLLRNMATEFRSSPFLTIMADETTDASS